jgi:hypothetical protein
MWRWLKKDESGQSIVEVAGVSIFLILLSLMIFEAGVVFASYVALLNASREGAVYASAHVELADETLTPEDGTEYTTYTETVVKGEVRLGNMVDATKLTIHRPLLVDGTDGYGDPIEARVDYSLYTFSSTIRLPWLGRFGLPDYWPLSAATTMPIR